MPSKGFRVGDEVRTPGGHHGRVTHVWRGAPERVQVELTNGALGMKTFHAHALRLLTQR